MSIKKTCNRCRALEPASNGIGQQCQLGYLIDKYGLYPLEKCPKPLTIKSLIKEIEK